MTEILFLIIGFLAGAFLTWIYISNKTANKFEKENRELDQKLRNETALRFNAEAELKAIKSSEEKMQKDFQHISQKIMQNNTDVFLKQAKIVLGKYSDNVVKDFQYSKESINEIIKPLKESLNKHEKLVENLQENSNKTFGSLKTYLTELSNSQKSLEKETGALVTALKSPKVRGRWGEIGLKRIVEFSGMSEYCDFDMQVSVTNEDGRMRPDMIVNLPGNKHIIVDSKAPLNSYLEMLETTDDAVKKELRSKHAKAVLHHVKDLSKKSYWSQFDDTVDFVILYIEVESAFGAALSENKNLIAEAISNRIVFATPTTLIALLQTIAYSWKQHEATENAIQIWKSSREIYERFAVFSGHLQKIGKNIETLTNTYNETIGSWDRRIIPGIKKMNSLGVDSGKKTVKKIDLINTIPK